MVTVKRAPPLKKKTIMSESYIEKYIRAKKRHEVRPKCLFGSPCRAETDEFLLQHDMNQMNDTREVYEKYDLTDIPDGPAKDDLFPKFELVSDDKREEKQAESNVKFQPKVVTEHDRPPGDNLFVPIEKAEPSGAVAAEKLTEYWQTSKRRRSSNSKDHLTSEDENKTTKDNVTEDHSQN